MGDFVNFLLKNCLFLQGLFKKFPLPGEIQRGFYANAMIKKALENLKITALNEMQQAAIAAAKKGDVILLSPTGSGKTLGFLLPLLDLLKPEVPEVQALIMVPSRELALQIEQVFKAIGSGFKVKLLLWWPPGKNRA